MVGIVEQIFVHGYIGDIIPYAAPLQDSFSGFATMSSSIFQLCGIAGAAIIFGGEYRWETWRAALTRVDRVPIMTAKMLAFAIAIAVSLILCGVARLIVGFIDMGLTGSATWPPVDAGSIVLAHLIGFAASFLQVMVTAAFVMLVCVVSRAMTEGIVATLLVLVGCEIASIRGNMGDDPLDLYGQSRTRSISDYSSQTSGSSQSSRLMESSIVFPMNRVSVKI